MYRWQIASSEEFSQIRDLFLASELGQGRGADDVQRRISIPLMLKQVISFYRNDRFCGFVTVAFLNSESEKHMETIGIQANDWRSGDEFWVVDFVADPHSNGFKMLRIVTRDLHIQRAKYFRHKHMETREVRPGAPI